jgi:hypothetical protein
MTTPLQDAVAKLIVDGNALVSEAQAIAAQLAGTPVVVPPLPTTGALTTIATQEMGGKAGDSLKDGKGNVFTFGDILAEKGGYWGRHILKNGADAYGGVSVYLTLATDGVMWAHSYGDVQRDLAWAKDLGTSWQWPVAQGPV